MSKIFITVTRLDEGGLIAFALAEDGKGLKHEHLTGDIFLRRVMGLIGTNKPREYSEHYPEGYDLVDYSNATDEELLADDTYIRALEINANEDSLSHEESTLDTDTKGQEDLGPTKQEERGGSN